MLRPPRFATAILRALSHGETGRDIAADLAEEFPMQLNERGLRRAQLWYWRQVLYSLLAQRRSSSASHQRTWPHAQPSGARGWPMGSDVRFTWRSAMRSPWYAGTVIGVMAVTIALATTTLAIVDGVLFRPLPFPDADQLVRIQPGVDGSTRPAFTLTGRVQVHGASLIDIEQWQLAVADVPMTGFTPRRFAGLGPGVNDHSAGIALIQPNFFDVIGVGPLFGGFAQDDFLHEVPMRPVLTTYQVWQARFGGRSDIVGTEIVTSRVPRRGVRIVGVMPAGFVFPSVAADVAFLAPLVLLSSEANDPTHRALFEVVARLPPSVTTHELRLHLMPAFATVARLFPLRGPAPYDTVEVTPLHASLGERAGPLFRAGMIAVLFLVLVGAANVSGLMTARALERERELTVRRSLGAGAAAIARLWSVEAGVLLLLAGVCGIAVTPFLLGLIVPLLPENVVLLRSPTVDWRVGVTMVTGIVVLVILVSVAPIRRSLVATAPGARGASEQTRGGGRVLVISGQVAVAFALTVIGSSLVGSVLAVYAQELPVRTAGVVAISVMTPATEDTADRSARIERLRQRLLRVSGIEAATASGAQVLDGGGAQPGFIAPAGTRHPANLDVWPVTDGFFDTLEPQLIAGRYLTPTELRTAAPVLVVSQQTADAYWPSGRALGQSLVHYWSKDTFTVVGVVRDIRWLSLDQESPIVYGPYARVSRQNWATFFLRIDRPAGPVLAEALSAIETFDPLVSVRRAAPLDQYFRETIALRRFQSWLFGGFAAAALVVVGAGLLGLLAMSAARRTREVGIRCALGATPSSVVMQMVREQLTAVLLGLFAGGGIAVWALGGIRAWLYQITPTDPRIWSAALLCLLVMAAIGILIPAVRASRTDPLIALRNE